MRAIFCFAVSCQLLHAYMGAEKDITSLDLEELLNIEVITVSRTSQSQKKAPGTVMVVTREQILERGYKDLKDIFRDLPGFDLSQEVVSEIRTLAIARGILGANKLMVLLDGQKLNASTGERLILGNNFPLHNIRQIEVIYGPSSVMYGADAYSGVVNMISMSPEDLKREGESFCLDASVGTNGSLDTSVVNFHQTDHFEYVFHFRRFGSEGFDPSKDFVQYSFDMLGYEYDQPIRDQTFYLKTKFSDFQFSWWHSSAFENGPMNPKVYRQNDSHQWTQYQDKLELRHEKQLKNGGSLNGIFAWEDFEYGKNNNFLDYYTGTHYYVYSYNESFRFEEIYQAKLGKNTDFLAGIRIEKQKAYSKTTDLRAPFSSSYLFDVAIYPDVAGIPVQYRNKAVSFGVEEITDKGIFAEVTRGLRENLQLNLGVRHDYNQHYDFTTPRLGLIYKKSENTNLKLLYSKAYIKPSAFLKNEHWVAFQSPVAGVATLNDFGYFPNPDLESEELESYQFNIEKKLRQDVSARLQFYRNHTKNLIRPQVVVPPANLALPFGMWSTNINGGEQTSQGFEFLLNQNRNRFERWLYWSYLDAQNDQGNSLNKVADHKVHAGVTRRYSFGSISFRGRWSDEIVKLQPVLPGVSYGTTGNIPGYTVFDFSLRLNRARGRSVYLTVNNLFDRVYYAAAALGEAIEGWPGDKAPQPGRYVELGVSLKF